MTKTRKAKLFRKILLMGVKVEERAEEKHEYQSRAVNRRLLDLALNWLKHRLIHIFYEY